MYTAFLLFLAVQSCSAPEERDETDKLDNHPLKGQPTPFQRIRGRAATLERPTLSLHDSASPSKIRKSYYPNKHSELSGRSANKKPVRKSSQSTTNNLFLNKRTNFSRLNVKKTYDFIQQKTRSTLSTPVRLRRKRDDGKPLQPKINLSRKKQKVLPRILKRKIVKYVKKSSQNATEKSPVANKEKNIRYVKTIYYVAKSKAKNHRNTSTIQPNRRKIQNRKMAVSRRQNGIPSRDPLENILRSRIKLKKNDSQSHDTLKILIQNLTDTKKYLQENITKNITWLQNKTRFAAGYRSGICYYLHNLALELGAMILYEADILTNEEQKALFTELLALGWNYKDNCTKAAELFKEAT